MGVQGEARVGVGAEGIAVKRSEARVDIDLSENLDIVLAPGDFPEEGGVQLIGFFFGVKNPENTALWRRVNHAASAAQGRSFLPYPKLKIFLTQSRRTLKTVLAKYRL